MGDWYQGLSLLQQGLLLIAVFSTAIFLIQTGMTLTGLGGDEFDAEIESDADALGFGDIFTIRNGVSFLMGFSWGGLMAFEWGLEVIFLVFVVAFFVGSLFVGVNIALFLGLSRLRYAGNINLDNALDETGRVTLTVPARRSGVGKVMVSVQGRLKEYHAVTDGEALARNAAVIIRDFSGSQLVVESAAQPVAPE